MMVGQNIMYEVKDGKIILTMDQSVDLGPTSTGRTHMVAKTGGWVTLPNGMKMNLNLVKK